jgi:hypothetical protein
LEAPGASSRQSNHALATGEDSHPCPAAPKRRHGLASVAVDSNGLGSVSKGDVQSALGWNNHDFDANSDNVVFSVKLTQVSRMVWSCAGQDFVLQSTQTGTKKVTDAYTSRPFFCVCVRRCGRS